MYAELYELWKNELENPKLGELPPDFYPRIAEYVRKLKEESRMLDRRAAKAALLRKEMANVNHMVKELVQSRCRKILRLIINNGEVPRDAWTPEEERIYMKLGSFADELTSFSNEVLRGQKPKAGGNQERTRMVLRFLTDVPSIVGADLEAYGPFKVEDIASVPAENAKSLIKRGLAEKVEID